MTETDFLNKKVKKTHTQVKCRNNQSKLKLCKFVLQWSLSITK